ncbi:HAMP domain-containing histidine kinase [Baekduia soli]|uniref:histidine kinase n=1 Tax=Baekduia soli TaxID=496014 RepID=A0A5B8U9X2_9ACTN|nr:ATP-binding protein [Baekduia soli]QEC49817.1 HAMP domain-containing histidine kinase [Baekduia soli]
MTVRRRLTTSTALIALAAVVVLGLPLGAVESARVRSDRTGRLEREADAVAGVLEDRIERHQTLTAAQLAPLVHRGHRVTVVAGGRTVQAGARLTGTVVTVRSGVLRAGSITASAPASEISDRIWRSWLLIAGFGVGGILVATGLAAVQARRLSRPLESVARTSARLGEGDFSVRAARSGVPEIDAIGQALDTSAERIAELVAREREFSSNVSHQLRTPLTALRLRLEESARAGDAEELRLELEAALVEADRLERMIAELLAYSRSATSGRKVPVALDAVVAEQGAAWAGLFRRAGRRLTLRAGAPVRAFASPGTVGQVLDVLLDNALVHGAGDVVVEVTADERLATIAVQDGGPGVPEADAERIFDRGATRAGGTGIGLHLARALAAADGATLRLASPAPARFELRLRRQDPARRDGATRRGVLLPSLPAPVGSGDGHGGAAGHDEQGARGSVHQPLGDAAQQQPPNRAAGA